MPESLSFNLTALETIHTASSSTKKEEFTHSRDRGHHAYSEIRVAVATILQDLLAIVSKDQLRSYLRRFSLWSELIEQEELTNRNFRVALSVGEIAPECFHCVVKSAKCKSKTAALAPWATLDVTTERGVESFATTCLNFFLDQAPWPDEQQQ